MRSSVSGLLFLISVASAATTADATVVNGRFANGFEGWTGIVTDVSGSVTSVSLPPGAYPGNFDASSGAGVLITSSSTNQVYAVFVVQTFFMDVAALNERLFLSYSVTPTLSNPGVGDAAFAELLHGASFQQAIDLLGATTVDVTFLSGQLVQIVFGVEDFDDISDRIVVDDVRVNVTPIPAPGSIVLLLFGLVFLGCCSKKPR